jgi:hypothetical protein
MDDYCLPRQCKTPGCGQAPRVFQHTGKSTGHANCPCGRPLSPRVACVWPRLLRGSAFQKSRISVMANCRSPQFCLLLNPPTRRPRGAPGTPVLAIDPCSGGRRLVRVGSAAPQLGRAPERAPADARQSVNRQLMRASRRLHCVLRGADRPRCARRLSSSRIPQKHGVSNTYCRGIESAFRAKERAV